MNVTINIRKLDKNAKIPTYGSEYAAGADLYACLAAEVKIPAGGTVVIPTGVALELPVGYAGLIYARSGLATKQGLAPANKVGVVDCDYRGEVKVALHNHSSEERTVSPGDRIAQLVITPYITAVFEEGELSETVRGAGVIFMQKSVYAKVGGILFFGKAGCKKFAPLIAFQRKSVEKIFSA